MKSLSILLAAVALSLSASAQTPQYINTGANHLTMNGADWSALSAKMARLAAGQDTVVRVLHIGDSHIQAEFVTNELRRLLQQQYGNAGRGLVSPSVSPAQTSPTTTPSRQRPARPSARHVCSNTPGRQSPD